MEDRVRALEEAVAAWDRRGWPRPRVAVVSGSGLAVDLGAPVHGPVPLAELLPCPVRPIAGHPHRVEVLRPRPDRPAVYFRGRLHAYQGYDPFDTVLAVRLAALLGARVLVMTNAAGGIAPELAPGSLALVSDHLNLTGLDPLRGDLPAAWGPRFPDLSGAYDPRLRRLIREWARERVGELGVELGEGVYAGVAGPSYETPAEVRMLRTLGADLVGMSTVLEVIAARQMGLACLVVSVVTNRAARDGGAPVTHEAVLAAGEAVREDLAKLLRGILEHEALEP